MICYIFAIVLKKSAYKKTERKHHYDTPRIFQATDEHLYDDWLMSNNIFVFRLYRNRAKKKQKFESIIMFLFCVRDFNWNWSWSIIIMSIYNVCIVRVCNLFLLHGSNYEWEMEIERLQCMWYVEYARIMKVLIEQSVDRKIAGSTWRTYKRDDEAEKDKEMKRVALCMSMKIFLSMCSLATARAFLLLDKKRICQ